MREESSCYRGEPTDGTLQILQIIQQELSGKQGEILQAAPLHCSTHTHTHTQKKITTSMTSADLKFFFPHSLKIVTDNHE